MNAQQTVGFVGGGRIVRIILGGWSRAGSLPPDVVVSDPDEAARTAISRQFAQVSVAADNATAAAADVVFLAVHPPAAGPVLAEIAPVLKPDAVLISLVPKIRTDKMAESLNGFRRIARVIPNAPSIVGAGYNPVAYAPGLPEEARAQVADLLAPLGHAPEVAEELLEAYAIVTAMGPTYFWFQFYLLEDLAREFGLSSEAAREAVTAMLEGAVRTMAESGLTPDAVLDLIPVKPLAAFEPTVVETMREKLTGLMAKLRG